MPGTNARDRAEELGGRPQKRVECSEGTRHLTMRQVFNRRNRRKGGLFEHRDVESNTASTASVTRRAGRFPPWDPWDPARSRT
jgi:hypothetical protein